MNRALLGIYLNDHLAGATGAEDLARRTLSNNRAEPYGPALRGFLRDLREDRAILESVMGTLGVRKSPIKPAAARVMERIARLKLNGRVTGYSPLSRVLELEALTLAVLGKRALWRTLERLQDGDLGEVDLEALVRRADSQRRSLENLRLKAVGELAQ